MSEQRKEALWHSLYYIVSVCVLYFSLMFPVINLFTIWFLPLPFFVLGVLYHRRTAAFVVLFLAVLSFFIPPMHVSYLWISFSIGYVMGRVYGDPRTSAMDVVLGGWIAGIISLFGFLYVGRIFFGVARSLQEHWDQILLHHTKQWQAWGISAEKAPSMEMVFSFCILIFLVISIFVTMWAGRKWLSYKQFPGKFLPPFRAWNLPRSFFYMYLFCVIGLFLSGSQTTPAEKSDPLLIIVSILHILFTVQGLSVIAHVLHHKKRGRRWMVLPILLACTPFAVVIQMMGVMDIGMGLKRRITE